MCVESMPIGAESGCAGVVMLRAPWPFTQTNPHIFPLQVAVHLIIKEGALISWISKQRQRFKSNSTVVLRACLGGVTITAFQGPKYT